MLLKLLQEDSAWYDTNKIHNICSFTGKVVEDALHHVGLLPVCWGFLHLVQHVKQTNCISCFL